MTDSFPVRAARMRDDGSVEVEFDVPTEHPINEVARQGTLEGLSIGPQRDTAPVVRPLDGRRRVIDGHEIEARRLEHVPLPGRVDLSKVLDLRLPEPDEDDAPPGMVVRRLSRAERRERDRRARRGRR